MKIKPKILYADDEFINLQLFKINFSNKYEVFTAENGKIGLEVLDNNPDITVVISDMRMPLMNGLEFIKKAKGKYPDIKFYILTGFQITEEIQEALDSKLILKYFSKPFDFNEIDAALLEGIGIKKSR